MVVEVIPAEIRVRRDTAAALASIVPEVGEPVYELDTKLQKIGDGSTPTADLDAAAFVDGTTKLFGPDIMAALDAHGIGVFGSPPVSVLSAAVMSKWFGALARVRARSGNAKLLCVGDSTTAGFGVGQASSWPALLTQRLSRDISAQPGLSLCMNLGVDSARWSLGGWQTVFGPGSGALYQDQGKTGADAVFTPGINVDTIDVWWFQGAGKGQFVVKIDGVPQSAIDTNGPAGAWLKTTYSVDAGTSHTVALQLPTGGGPVSVLGVDAYLSTQNSVRVANWGVSGSVTDTWANGPYSLSSISSYAPDLTIVMLGINDANSSVPVATWQANITAIVNEAKKSGDVLLMSVVPSNPTDGPVTIEQQYRAATPSLAANLDVPYLDLFGKFGAYSADRYADSLHPNVRGHADAARWVTAALQAL